MNDELYEKLKEDGTLSLESLEKILDKQQNPLFSVHWELKTLLYLGVMLLSTGLGILIYKNIDTIGHQVILLIIAAISAGCFFYCFKHKKPFDTLQVKSPNSLFDYLLLLGSLSFLTFVGYLQFQYGVFGNNYGMATFIPMIGLFYVAYAFDHLGILSLAITNLGVWMGVSITPAQLLSNSHFNSDRIILTYLLLGAVLILAAYLSERFDFKKHFRFSYLHFGVHLAFTSLLAGYFYHFENPVAIIWPLGLFGVAVYVYADAMKHKSFYFLLLVVLYSYIAISAVVIRVLIAADGIGAIYLGFMYFIASAIGLIILLNRLNKKIKAS